MAWRSEELALTRQTGRSKSCQMGLPPSCEGGHVSSQTLPVYPTLLASTGQPEKGGDELIAAARDSLPLRAATQLRRGTKHHTPPRSCR